MDLPHPGAAVASAAAEATPLLGAFGPPRPRGGPRKPRTGPEPAAKAAGPRGRPPGGGGRKPRPAAWGAVRGLVGRLGLHRPARWWELGLPAALAVANVWVTAQVGLVAGAFYLALGEADEAAFWAALRGSLGWFALAAAVSSLTAFSGNLLSLRWRRRLTSAAHQQYFEGLGFFWLLNGAGPQRGKTAGVGREEGEENVDNPDQRIQRDVALFADHLAQTAAQLVAVPFMVFYYSWLVAGYVGLQGVGIACGFFVLGLVLQYGVAHRLPSLVARQERLEGDFRGTHFRVRHRAQAIALAGGAQAEREAADLALGAVLGNQKLLLVWHLALKGVTSAMEYLGSAANYLTFAAPVFSGRGRWAGLTPAQVAQRVSNSSFATLQLVYSFTQLLDASRMFTDLAGYALRVQQLLAALEAAQTAPTPTSEVAEAALAVDVDAAEGGGGGADPDLERVHGFTAPATGANENVDGTLRKRRGAPWMRKPPSLVEFCGEPVEYSVHAAPPALRPELFRLFPQLARDAVPFERLLLVPTFQFYTQAGPSDPNTNVEMDRLLERFLELARRVRGALAAEGGWWCDAVDPKTAQALFGPRGSRYSEVRGAALLLGYHTVEDAGPCALVTHPRHGVGIYPATLCSNAPPAALARALEALGSVGAAHTAPAPSIDRSTSMAPAGPGSGLAVAAERLTVRDPTGAVVVRDLTVAVPEGGSLLVIGPTGCGKTTLVRALAELWRPSAGTLAVPARARPPGVLVLPQRPLLAPGRTLREQLLYPEAAPPSSAEEAEEAELRALLEAVELGHLLDRVAGRWDAPWEGWGALTPGELQRLGVARVLRRRPALAVLDEATAAVDEAAEARLYGQVRRAAAAIVSVGHRESLKQQHRVVLSLAGDGSGDWSLSRLSRS